MNRLARLIVLGASVPSQNVWDRMHWGKRMRLKADWRLILIAARNARPDNPAGHWEPGDGWKPAVKGEKRVLVVTHYRKRLLDSDNLTAASKSLIVDNVKGSPLWFLWDDDNAHAEVAIEQHGVPVDVPMVKIEVFGVSGASGTP